MDKSREHIEFIISQCLETGVEFKELPFSKNHQLLCYGLITRMAKGCKGVEALIADIEVQKDLDFLAE